MYKQKLFSYLQVLLLNIYLIRYGNSSGGHLENDKNLIVSLVKTPRGFKDRSRFAVT